MSVDIVIVGGGPAGLSVAFHLAKKGIASTVLESRSEEQFREKQAVEAFDIQGRSYPLALRDRGLDLLDRLSPDVRSEVERRSHAVSTCMWRTPQGPPKISTDDDGQACYTTRATILAVLAEKIEKSYSKLVKIEFGRRISKMTKKADGSVHLDFKDGEPMDAWVVIGADGVNSVVRDYVKVETGAQVVEFYDPTPYKMALFPPNEVLGKNMHLFTVRGVGNVLVFPFSDGYSSAAILVNPDNKEWCRVRELCTTNINGKASDSDITLLVSFLETNFPKVAEAIGSSKDVLRQFIERGVFDARTVKCDKYNAGNVLVIGDAAHATLPTTGQGVQASIYDAHVLLGADNAKWDGRVSTAAAAFASFSATEAPDRAALFEAGKWVAENRWNMKYIALFVLSIPCSKLNKKFPWMVNKPLYQFFNTPDARYQDAWESFCRQALALRVIGVLLALCILLPVLSNVGWWWLFCLVCLIPTVKSPHHAFSLGKHMFIIPTTLYHIVYGTSGLMRDYAVVMLINSLILAAHTTRRKSVKAHAKLTEDYHAQLDSLPTKNRVMMIGAFSLIYLGYMSPLFTQMGDNNPRSTRSLLGIVMMIGGAFLQAYADFHKYSHKARYGAASLCMQWPYSFVRHPNYLGEIVLWSGWFLGLAPLRFVPIVMACVCCAGKCYIMRGAAARLEKSQRERYLSKDGKKAGVVKAYFATVPALFPLTKQYTLQ